MSPFDDLKQDTEGDRETGAPITVRRRRCHRIPAVAEDLDTSPSSVRRLIREGHLEAIYIGSSVRVTDESLEALLKTGTRRRRPRGKK